MTQPTINNDTNEDDNEIRQRRLEVQATSPNLVNYSIVMGILLINIGSIGMVLPEFMALEVTILIATMLMVSSIFWLVHAFTNKLYGWSKWLKPLILLVTAGFMMFYPLNGAAAIGVLLLAYLILDAFGSFTFAYILKPIAGWGWMVFNGICSLILAFLFLIGWPESTLVIAGLYIAISLFLDGWSLLYMGWMELKLISKKA